MTAAYQSLPGKSRLTAQQRLAPHAAAKRPGSSKARVIGTLPGQLGSLAMN
jgi:hypothetical protein